MNIDCDCDERGRARPSRRAVHSTARLTRLSRMASPPCSPLLETARGADGAPASWFVQGGQPTFLNGLNLAWVRYPDFTAWQRGDTAMLPSICGAEDAMRFLVRNGGNALRVVTIVFVWLLARRPHAPRGGTGPPPGRRARARLDESPRAAHAQSRRDLARISHGSRLALSSVPLSLSLARRSPVARSRAPARPHSRNRVRQPGR